MRAGAALHPAHPPPLLVFLATIAGPSSILGQPPSALAPVACAPKTTLRLDLHASHTIPTAAPPRSTSQAQHHATTTTLHVSSTASLDRSTPHAPSQSSSHLTVRLLGLKLAVWGLWAALHPAHLPPSSLFLAITAGRARALLAAIHCGALPNSKKWFHPPLSNGQGTLPAGGLKAFSCLGPAFQVGCGLHCTLRHPPPPPPLSVFPATAAGPFLAHPLIAWRCCLCHPNVQLEAPFYLHNPTVRLLFCCIQSMLCGSRVAAVRGRGLRCSMRASLCVAALLQALWLIWSAPICDVCHNL